MRKLIVLLMILFLTTLIGCSVKQIGGTTGEQSAFDKTIEDAKILEEANRVVPGPETIMTTIKLIPTDDGVKLYAIDEEGIYRSYNLPLGIKSDLSKIGREVDFEDIQDEQSMDSGTVRTTTIKEINGYYKGHYHVERLKNNSSTVVFVDGTSGKHLDLLEIDHDFDSWISDVYVAENFRTVRYTLSFRSGMKVFEHDLTSNITKEVNIDGMALIHLDSKNMVEVNYIIDPSVTIYNKITVSTAETKVMDQRQYDKVIANGIVVDPETKTYKFGYDVGIIDNMIVAISDATMSGEEIIDATGLMVSPGFIDMLSYNITHIGAKYKITDGVTTSLLLHGTSVDFEGWLAYYETYAPYVNYGGSVFAIKLRQELGLGSYGQPSKEDIVYMAERVREEIEAGALALSISPGYYPGTTPEEIRAMMAVAAEYDIPTHFHVRSSSRAGDDSGIEGVKEVIGYAKELDARVQIMHLHSTAGKGNMNESLRLINKARAEGYAIAYDIYPYDSWAAQIKGQKYADGWQELYGMTYSDLQMTGTSVRLNETTFNQYRKTGGHCIAFAMEEDEMLQALSEDYAMVGSDGTIETDGVGDDHSRGAGSFSRILGKYVREENAFSLMDGLTKMTINSARHLEMISEAMALRGRMQEGCIADITIFDYRTIIDKAVPEAPATTSDGIWFVFVNGEIGIRDGELDTSVREGQPIRSDF